MAPSSDVAALRRIASAGSTVRPLVWLFHMSLPMIGLWLLITHPDLDFRWLDSMWHFVVVSLIALTSAVLGYLVNEAARRRHDVRLFLVGLSFISSAGFLFVHGVATPGVMVDMNTSGFELGVPIGLTLSAFFAVVSGLNFRPETAAKLLGRARLIQAGLLFVLLLWGVATVAQVPVLSGPFVDDYADGMRPVLAVCGGALYAIAVIRYYREFRRRHGVVLLSIMTAFLLLAEALISIPVAPQWHVTWWLWHVLIELAFGYVAYSAHIEYRLAGDTAGLFDGISTQATIARLRDEYGTALESMVQVMLRQESGDTLSDAEIVASSRRLGTRFDLSEGQTAVLVRAAQALSGERSQLTRLGALVGIGQQASVIRTEQDVLRSSLQQIVLGFPNHRVQLGLVTDGSLGFPAELSTDSAAPPEAEANEALETLRPAETDAGGLVLPLLVKGQPSGVLHVQRGWGEFDRRDRALLESLAAQLSIVLENTRLYRQLDGLFRQYMSPDLVTSLMADPSRAELGGALLEVSVLFADLQGFTTLSEQVTPHEIVEMLNRNFAAATRAVLDEGGTVVQFEGDAMMALFNAPVRQPDHPIRAARAALALQSATEKLRSAELDTPRFRVGVNTGGALVGNIGSEQLRIYTAMGDAVNVAARLQTSAEPGTVVISRGTLGRLDGQARTTPLGPLTLKGRSGVVEAFVLRELSAGGS